MIVVGRDGEEIGAVERLEIDEGGRLKALVIRIASSLGTSKRVTVEQIRSIHGGIVRIAVSAAEVGSLADVPEPAITDLWPDDPVRGPTAA